MSKKVTQIETLIELLDARGWFADNPENPHVPGSVGKGGSAGGGSKMEQFRKNDPSFDENLKSTHEVLGIKEKLPESSYNWVREDDTKGLVDGYLQNREDLVDTYKTDGEWDSQKDKDAEWAASAKDEALQAATDAKGNTWYLTNVKGYPEVKSSAKPEKADYKVSPVDAIKKGKEAITNGNLDKQMSKQPTAMNSSKYKHLYSAEEKAAERAELKNNLLASPSPELAALVDKYGERLQDYDFDRFSYLSKDRGKASAESFLFMIGKYLAGQEG